MKFENTIITGYYSANVDQPMADRPMNYVGGTEENSGYTSAAQVIRRKHIFIPREKEAIKKITEKYDSSTNYVASDTFVPPCNNEISDNNEIPVFDDNNFSDGLSEADILQVDMSFRSHKTEVQVCQCLANLYFGPVQAVNSSDVWRFSLTGIPVLVLDTGEHHRKRKLKIVIAEKGTGFILWQDVIDHLTNYSAPNGNFHTMLMSTDHTKLAGLSFDDSSAAGEFYRTLKRLTSDPNDELLNISKMSKKKKKKEKPKKFKAPKKAEISQPCCFVHVTKLERPKFPSAVAIHTLVSQPFEFEHITRSESHSDNLIVSSLAQNMDSALTLKSSDSVNSGLSTETI